MANILSFLIPREKKFFPLFDKAAENLVAISTLLEKMVNTNDPEQRKAMIREIERMEHHGDTVCHEIFNELNSTFITPFDREDIHALNTALDDIIDYVHGSAKRIDLYQINELTPSIKKLSELILQASIELNVAVRELRNMKKPGKIKEACVRINSIENHADDIFDTAIARLFEEEKDAIKVIKMKEVLSNLETATDMCEDAANVIETIIVKYA
jgi:predicted phosphate transport protein (TIGR00153 family)